MLKRKKVRAENNSVRMLVMYTPWRKLLGTCLEGSKNEKVFSQETLQKFKVNTPQALNKALSLLMEKGFLEKNGGYHFNDPLFKRYLAEKE